VTPSTETVAYDSTKLGGLRRTPRKAPRMPSVSGSQQRLFGAVRGGAQFPLARHLRATMSARSIHDFAATQRRGLPAHVAPPHKKRLADRMTALRGAGAFRK
jgi:hypothetical protein